MKIYPLFLALLFISQSLLSARTWTSSDGKKLQADFVSATAGEVTLKRSSDGQVFTLPLNRLSDFDQRFVEEQEGVEAPAESADAVETVIEGDYAYLVTGDWVLAEHKNLPYAFYGGKNLGRGSEVSVGDFLAWEK